MDIEVTAINPSATLVPMCGWAASFITALPTTKQ